jgi:hypothetical protein
MPNSTNPLYSAALVLINTLLFFLTPPRSYPNLFSLKYISNVAIIIKSVAILIPIITLDIRWLLYALTKKFIYLQVDLFKIFYKPLIYKTKT